MKHDGYESYIKGLLDAALVKIADLEEDNAKLATQRDAYERLAESRRQQLRKLQDMMKDVRYKLGKFTAKHNPRHSKDRLLEIEASIKPEDYFLPKGWSDGEAGRY